MSILPMVLHSFYRSVPHNGVKKVCEDAVNHVQSQLVLDMGDLFLITHYMYIRNRFCYNTLLCSKFILKCILLEWCRTMSTCLWVHKNAIST